MILAKVFLFWLCVCLCEVPKLFLKICVPGEGLKKMTNAAKTRVAG